MHLLGRRAGKDGFRPLHHATLQDLQRDWVKLRKLLVTYRQFETLQYLETYVFGKDWKRVAHWAMCSQLAFAQKHRAAEVAVRVLGSGLVEMKLPSIVVLNMMAEAFFKVFKYGTLKGRQGNRLDGVVAGVVQYFKRAAVKLIARPAHGVSLDSEAVHRSMTNFVRDEFDRAAAAVLAEEAAIEDDMVWGVEVEGAFDGLSVDGLSVDGLAVHGLSVHGLAVDGLAVDSLLAL